MAAGSLPLCAAEQHAIGADLAWCGLAGSPTKVHRVQSIVLTKEGYTEVPATQEGIHRMIHELIVDHTLG